jgi:hypothetical protein
VNSLQTAVWLEEQHSVLLRQYFVASFGGSSTTRNHSFIACGVQVPQKWRKIEKQILGLVHTVISSVRIRVIDTWSRNRDSLEIFRGPHEAERVECS